MRGNGMAARTFADRNGGIQACGECHGTLTSAIEDARWFDREAPLKGSKTAPIIPLHRSSAR